MPYLPRSWWSALLKTGGKRTYRTNADDGEYLLQLSHSQPEQRASNTRIRRAGGAWGFKLRGTSKIVL